MLKLMSNKYLQFYAQKVCLSKPVDKSSLPVTTGEFEPPGPGPSAGLYPNIGRSQMKPIVISQFL